MSLVKAECGFFFCEYTNVMTIDQKTVTRIYSWACLFVFAVILGVLFFRRGYLIIANIFYLTSAQKQAQQENYTRNDVDKDDPRQRAFRALGNCDLYVPRVLSSELMVPVVVVDTKDIPEIYVPQSIQDKDNIEKDELSVVSEDKLAYIDFNIKQGVTKKSIIDKMFSVVKVQLIFFSQFAPHWPHPRCIFYVLCLVLRSR